MSSLSWFIARRYLTAERRQAFISVISAFSVIGVGVGVAAVIIALALMTGVQGEMRDRILGSTAHVYVTPLGVMGDWATEKQKVMVTGVVGAAPVVQGAALMDSGSAKAQFAFLKGIDPVEEATVTEIVTAMRSGSLEALTDVGPEERDRILLGAGLAQKLGVRVGDLIDVTTATLTTTPRGQVPRRRPFRVAGIFEFGFFEIDDQFGLISLSTSLDLLRTEQPDLIQLKLENADEAPAVKARLQAALGATYDVQDWTDLNATLYSALWLEKVAISLAIGLIVMVAALNIVVSLALLVMEKTRDIAILRTMGTPARSIRRIFVLQGLAIGAAGTGAGVVLGVGISVLADRLRLISMPADVYHISHLPFRVQPLDVTVVVVAAMLICLTATVYPSWRAGRVDPAEALRHG